MTNYSIKNVSWDDIVKLSDKIVNEINARNLQIDTLVPILRGGLPLSLLITNRLKNVETSCIQIKRSISNVTNADFGKPTFLGITNSNQIAKKNVLICEDIIDNGESLNLAIKEIKKYNPKSITIATLFNFNKNKYKDAISGVKMKEYYWIKFPWEV